MKKLFLYILTWICFSTVFASEERSSTSVFFTENNGQWKSEVLFRMALPQGFLYLEKDRLTFQMYEEYLSNSHHNHSHEGDNHQNESIPDKLNMHVFSLSFLNSEINCDIEKNDQLSHYKNYFLGNNPNTWAGNCKNYNEIIYKNIYPNIDFKIYDAGGKLKYDFIIHPGADVSKIKWRVEGVDSRLEEDFLVHKVKFGDIAHKPIYAYQNTEEIQVDYLLEENIIRFIPEEYDRTKDLIIDPELTFASYTGSTADNFGQTASYDLNQNLLAAGTVFDIGYPTTFGAYDITFNGGFNDVGYSKFDASTGALIYSTYYGGNNAEAPHSIVVNSKNEVIIMGTTGSADFPTNNAYQNTFKGSSFDPIPQGSGYGMTYVNGCDLYVVKFSSNGNQLNGATYVGGDGVDGINNSSDLLYNYGDHFRGEVIVDSLDRVIVASNSDGDFPLVNATQTTYGGGAQDAVIFRLSEDLSNLEFSTFIGGSGDDAAYSVQLDRANNMFIAGGTNSVAFPTGNGVVNPNELKFVDGFVSRIENDLSNVSSSYVGTRNYDQAFFVQLDINDNVWLYGQSKGDLSLTNGVYSDSNSGQFIQKWSNSLDTILISTEFGTGSGSIDISPSAFLVSDCGTVYISGWGGETNHYYKASRSTTIGLKVTNDALLSTTDGSDFYLAVFAQDMGYLMYASYMGGGVSEEHVDGGTSRFDKQGNVYQALCGGCRGNSDFPTTPGAASNTNNASNCNLAVFKFDLGVLDVQVGLPSGVVCLPDTTFFNLQTNSGNVFYWDFGDGNTSTLQNPSHLYADSGSFDVTVIISDTLKCFTPDTLKVDVETYSKQPVQVLGKTSICKNDSAFLELVNADDFYWTPTISLLDDTSSFPVFYPEMSTNYLLIENTLCGEDTTEVEIIVFDDSLRLSDTSVCKLNTSQITLNVDGGVSYEWSSDLSIVGANTSSPVVNTDTSGMYYVSAISPNGCLVEDSIWVSVFENPPLIQVIIPKDTICKGEVLNVISFGGDVNTWSGIGVSDLGGGAATITGDNNLTITAVSENSCGRAFQDFNIYVHDFEMDIIGSGWLCKEDTLILRATQAESYDWFSSDISIISSDSNYVKFTADQDGAMIGVVGTDINGCVDSAFKDLNFNESPNIETSGDEIIDLYAVTNIWATSNNGVIEWDEINMFSCNSCSNQTVGPDIPTVYYVQAVSDSGCEARDSVQILINEIIYVPNTFTPNGDGENDYFIGRGVYIYEYEMFIFDRWGQLLFHGKDLEETWDGTANGRPCKIDTYVWRIKYSGISGLTKTIQGHVNLVR